MRFHRLPRRQRRQPAVGPCDGCSNPARDGTTGAEADKTPYEEAAVMIRRLGLFNRGSVADGGTCLPSRSWLC